jgi:hypothetical protein
MKRVSLLAAWAFFLLAGSAFGQGVLIIIDPPHPVPLPRPIIRPLPTPLRCPYKIKELDYYARVVDQVAQSSHAVVCEHRQPADGGQLRLSAAV